jgi:uncharacterized protein (TIGR02271 family)
MFDRQRSAALEPQDLQVDERRVTTRDGARGRARPFGDARVLVTLDDGRSMVVRPELLEPQTDGSCLLTLDTGRVAAAGRADDTVIPVMREELDVRKRMTETGRGIRVHKQVSEREEQVVQLLYREDIEVQHHARNQFVDRPLPVHYEGETLVIPLCEEVLVIEKRLLLKEEIHVSRRAGHLRHAESVVLRSESASIERFDEQDASTAPVDSPRT